MRKLFAILTALLLFMVSALGAIAQDATPAADEPLTAGAVDPAVGDTATYVDVSGNPVAHVTVDSVVRDWQDYGEYDEPDPGVEKFHRLASRCRRVGNAVILRVHS